MRSSLVCAAVVWSACAHTPDLPLRPDPAPPAGATVETFAARDGTQLLARRWAAGPDVRGVLVIVHGLKDYSARYASIATRAAAAGFVVYAYDLRGHGRSAGPRVAPDAWTDYVDDTDRFLAMVESREPHKPVFLFGHSMGGAIATRTAEVHRPAIAGLILSGPALAIDAPPLLIAATRMTGALLPRFPALDLDNHFFSSDPANAAAMDHDELVSNPAAPASTAAGLVEGMHLIWFDLQQLTMPLLAMHGTADKLTAPSGSRELVRYAPNPDKQLRIYDGYYHDLLHEPGDKGKRVEDDMLAWLAAHVGGAAVAAPPLYAGDLAGDPRGWSQEIELGGGVVHNTSTHAFGQLSVELARPSPVGWHGMLAVRGFLSPGVFWGTLQPLGVAVRGGPLTFGASAGGSFVCCKAQAYWSAGGWVDVALMPLVHLDGFGEIDFASGQGTVWIAGGTMRFIGDRTYWPRARAGVGPMISVGEMQFGSLPTTFFALVGLELYGAD